MVNTSVVIGIQLLNHESPQYTILQLPRSRIESLLQVLVGEIVVGALWIKPGQSKNRSTALFFRAKVSLEEVSNGLSEALLAIDYHLNASGIGEYENGWHRKSKTNRRWKPETWISGSSP